MFDKISPRAAPAPDLTRCRDMADQTPVIATDCSRAFIRKKFMTVFETNASGL